MQLAQKQREADSWGGQQIGMWTVVVAAAMSTVPDRRRTARTAVGIGCVRGRTRNWKLPSTLETVVAFFVFVARLPQRRTARADALRSSGIGSGTIPCSANTVARSVD